MNFRRSVFILVVFSLLAGLHLFIFAQNISLKYRITDLKVKLAELSSRNRQLASQVARAENLGQIEKSAREKLGMIYPENVIYIVGSREVNPRPN
jgi:cell division protein FtsB